MKKKSVQKVGKIGQILDLSTLLQKGLILHQIGRLEEARVWYRKVLAVNPKHFDSLHFSAVLESQLGRLEIAVKLFDQALAVNTTNAAVFSNRGNALKELNRLDDALASYDAAIRINPDYADAFYNRAITLKALNRLDDALASYNEAIRIKPNYAEAFSNRGITLKALNRLDEALASYNDAIRIKPNYAEALSNRGNLLKELGRLDESLGSYEEAIRLKPDYAEAINNRGIALKALKRLDVALASFQKAIRMKPNYAEALYNQGNVLHELKRLDEAKASYEEAIRIKPDYVEAFSNRGVSLHELNRLDEAIASYEDAIRIRPDYPDAYWNKSHSLLLRGQFMEGWSLYEWRLIIGDSNDTYCPGQGLPWRGEKEIFGKRLLIHSEQGLGDSLQFVRYLPMVVDLGAEVSFLVEKPLLSLFKSMNLPVTLVAKGDALPSFDAYCPLMSLPYVFKTTLETIPAAVPYLFADERKIAQFQQKLGLKKRLRGGLVWSGSSTHKNDVNRSIPLDLLLSLLDLPIEWHSLHKEYRSSDEALLNQELEIKRHEVELADYSDTAALIACLDIVISVDTSVAHLAGAMGKEVWVLLPYVPDFRWLMDRDDSPWYPTARLLRQDERRDWATVVSRMKELLNLLLCQHGSFGDQSLRVKSKTLCH